MAPWRTVASILFLAAGAALEGCSPPPPREKPPYQDIGAPADPGRLSLPADLAPETEGEAVRQHRYGPFGPILASPSGEGEPAQEEAGEAGRRP